MEEKQKELLATATSPAQKDPTSSVRSHCSPVAGPAPSHSSAPKEPLTTHKGNQEFKHKPLKSQLLDTQSANTFAEEVAVADGCAAKQCTELSTSKMEMTFILGNSSFDRPRQCNLNQPLRYHGKSLFDLPSL